MAKTDRQGVAALGTESLPPTHLAEVITADLHAAACPANAAGAEKYMRYVQKFLGVPTPARRRIVRMHLANHPDRELRWQAVAQLWVGQYREQRYAALDVATACRPTVEDLPRLEQMLAQTDHWDLLDPLANLLGRLLVEHPVRRRQCISRWRVSPHLWTRRAAIIGQLQAKDRTDTVLLRETIAVLCLEQEFFIQKAIGWALRQYARTDPQWVVAVVAELGLTGLARREALKHLHV